MMKTYLWILPVLLFAGVFGCKPSTSTSDSNWLRTSAGKPYEVLVVMDREKWDGAVGDSLRPILWQPFPWVNQYEPMYTLYHSTARRFSGWNQQYRNVLVYRINPERTKPSMTAEYDKWSKPQIVVYIDGPTDSAALAYVNAHQDALLQIFDQAEQDRFALAARTHTDKEIQDKVLAGFGVHINIPKGYTIRSEHPGFIWISFELPLVSQGIVIYKYPLTTRRVFTPDSLFARRNEFVRLIPGPSDGSYMITSDITLPQVVQTEFNDRVWFRAQGFWDVRNDFMGGPYTSYSTVDATTREVITIDTYVFSPKYDKRQYVRQLQSIAQTATIPGDTVMRVNFSELPE